MTTASVVIFYCSRKRLLVICFQGMGINRHGHQRQIASGLLLDDTKIASGNSSEVFRDDLIIFVQ